MGTTKNFDFPDEVQLFSIGHLEEKIDWMKQFPDFHHVLTPSRKHWVELSHLLPQCRGERSERKHNFELNSIFFNLAEWFPADLRTAIYVSRRTFSVTFFWKISFLYCFLDFEQKSCKPFHELLLALFSELTSSCPEKQIEKTSILWKIQTLLIDSGLWAVTQYHVWQKWFRQACQKWLLLVQRKFWKKQFFENFYQSNLFQNLSANCLPLLFAQTASLLCAKWLTFVQSWEPRSTCPEERFWRFLLRNLFCPHSRSLSRIFVRILAKRFWQKAQNWILCVLLNKLMKKFYGLSQFFHHTWTLSINKKKLLVKMVPASLSKVTFTRSEKLFEEKTFFKTFIYVTCSRNWAKIF